MSSYIVYKATSPSSKVYIGATKGSLKDRIGQHISLSKSGKTRPFQCALKKYEYLFTWEIIESGLSREKAEELEKYYIQLYNSTDREYGYNLSPGGLSGAIMSEEGKIRHKEKMRVHYDDPEYIKRMSEAKRKSLAEDPNSSEKQGFYADQYYADPENRAKNKKRMQDMSTSRGHREFMAKVKGGKPFICMETDERFVLLQDAADRFGVDKRRIHAVLKYPERNKTISGKYTFKYLE